MGKYRDRFKTIQFDREFQWHGKSIKNDKYLLRFIFRTANDRQLKVQKGELG